MQTTGFHTISETIICNKKTKKMRLQNGFQIIVTHHVLCQERHHNRAKIICTMYMLYNMAANSKRANKQTNSVMAWYLLACACQTATKDLYQVYETFKNLCEFSSVWAENFWRFANANFEGLFYVFMGKKSTKLEFLHNCTKTLINIKVKKKVNFGFKI